MVFQSDGARGVSRRMVSRARCPLVTAIAMSILLVIAGACSEGNIISNASSATQQPSLPTPTPVLVSNDVATSSAIPNVAAVAPTTSSKRPTSQTSPTTAATPSASAGHPSPIATPGASPTADAAQELAGQIDPLLRNLPAHVGMVISLPDGTTLYQNEEDTEFESASLYKLGIMVELYRQRDVGDLSFDDLVTLYPGYFLEDDSVYDYDDNAYDKIPISTLLDNMITLSSNVAATALLDVVGTDNVNATMESLGLDHTKILWYPVPGAMAPDTDPNLTARSSGQTGTLLSLNARAAPLRGDTYANVDGAYNITTPRDIATLFQMLVNGTVVSADASSEMLDLLAKQQINDRLPAGLPAGTRVAHKTGDLDNSVHDAGVIYAPKGPIVVAVLSDQVDNRQDVVDFIQRVAQLAYGLESP